MLLFGAANPWLSWAFIAVTDSLNAEPLTRETMFNGAKTPRANTTRIIEGRDVWQSSKDYVLRTTHHGDYGTIEFRAFEMPEDVETLEKYVNLVNAICKHVAAQTYTEFKVSSIPTARTLKAMTWRKRVDGFNSMLLTLGLDPADYREERAQIIRRVRYFAALDREKKKAKGLASIEPVEIRAWIEDSRPAADDSGPIRSRESEGPMPTETIGSESFSRFWESWCRHMGATPAGASGQWQSEEEAREYIRASVTEDARRLMFSSTNRPIDLTSVSVNIGPDGTHTYSIRTPTGTVEFDSGRIESQPQET